MLIHLPRQTVKGHARQFMFRARGDLPTASKTLKMITWTSNLKFWTLLWPNSWKCSGWWRTNEWKESLPRWSCLMQELLVCLLVTCQHRIKEFSGPLVCHSPWSIPYQSGEGSKLDLSSLHCFPVSIGIHDVVMPKNSDRLGTISSTLSAKFPKFTSPLFSDFLKEFLTSCLCQWGKLSLYQTQKIFLLSSKLSTVIPYRSKKQQQAGRFSVVSTRVCI